MAGIRPFAGDKKKLLEIWFRGGGGEEELDLVICGL